MSLAFGFHNGKGADEDLLRKLLKAQGGIISRRKTSLSLVAPEKRLIIRRKDKCAKPFPVTCTNVYTTAKFKSHGQERHWPDSQAARQPAVLEMPVPPLPSVTALDKPLPSLGHILTCQ